MLKFGHSTNGICCSFCDDWLFNLDHYVWPAKLNLLMFWFFGIFHQLLICALLKHSNICIIKVGLQLGYSINGICCSFCDWFLQTFQPWHLASKKIFNFVSTFHQFITSRGINILEESARWLHICWKADSSTLYYSIYLKFIQRICNLFCNLLNI